MSERIVAWSQTVSLSPNEVAIVAAKRGGAQLRLLDPPQLTFALTWAWVDGLDAPARARGDVRSRLQIPAMGAPMERLEIDAGCLGPLLAAIGEALRFAEGE